MGHKVFVSYKYSDPYVQGAGLTCRNYVDALIEKISDIHIYKGEEDGNDLSGFSDDTIETKLKEKIRDSSVTVVLVSKGMKEQKSELNQWIPWEIKYSLLRTTVDGQTSNPNGLLGVIIPDENGSYNYYFQPSNCPHCNTIHHNVDMLFEIMRNNMFNRKQPIINNCVNPAHDVKIHAGDNHSYLHPIQWGDFFSNPTLYIEHAISLRDRIDEFDVQKRIKKT